MHQNMSSSTCVCLNRGAHIWVCECAHTHTHTHRHPAWGGFSSLNLMVVKAAPMGGAACHLILLGCSPGPLLSILFPVWLPAFLSVNVITSRWKKGKEVTLRLCPQDAKTPWSPNVYKNSLFPELTGSLFGLLALEHLRCDLLQAPQEWRQKAETINCLYF